MFTNFGWGEILLILVVAVVVFGPDRLPKLAADLAKGIRMVRGWAQKARNELADEVGPEFRDLDLTALNPRTFIQKALLEDDPLDDAPTRRSNGSVNGSAVGSANGSPSAAAQLPPGEQAPYDSEAT